MKLMKELVKNYYTPKEIAKILGLSVETIWRYIRTGKIKALRLTPKSYLVPKKEFQKWLNKIKTK